MKLTRRAACGLVMRGLVGASAAAFLTGEAQAASRRKPEFRFTESYARKVVRVRDEDGSQVFEPVESGKFNLFARIPLDAIDTTEFDEDTALTIELEETVFDLLLGDDPNYQAGRTSARISYSNTDENGTTLVHLSIILHWTTKELTVRMRGRTPEFQEPILAGEYLDEISSRYEDVSEAIITVEDTSHYFDVDYTGRVVSQTVVRGPEREEFDVSSSSLQAKGLYAGVDELGRRSQRRAVKGKR